MNAEQRIAINTLSKYAATLIVFAVGFFLTPFLIRTIGEEQLSLQVLARQAMQFCLLISTAFGLGFSRFAKADYARGDIDAMNRTISCGFLLSIISAAIILAITAGLIVFIKPLLAIPDSLHTPAAIVFAATGSAAALGIILAAWEAPLFITETFYLREITNTIATLAAAIAVVLAFHYWFTPSIVTWVLISVGASLLFRLLILLPAARRKLPQMAISLSSVRTAQLRTILNFSTFAFIGMLGNLLFNATDSFLITHLPSLTQADIYYYDVAFRWQFTLTGIIVAFSLNLTPAFTELASLGQTEALQRMTFKAVRYALTIAIFPATTFFVYAAPFYTLWLGGDYPIRSAPILRLVMATFLLSVPAIIFYQTLTALNRIREVSIATLICGIGNIALSIVFVTTFDLGLIGVALGTFIPANVNRMILYPIMLHRHMPFSLSRLWKVALFRPAFCFAVVLTTQIILINLYPPRSWLALITHLTLSALIVLPALLRVGLDAEDRQKAASAIKKTINAIRPH